MDSPRSSSSPRHHFEFMSDLARVRSEWLIVIVTAAFTSAAVSLFTVWMWNPVPVQEDEWVDAVVVEYEPLEIVESSGDAGELEELSDASPAVQPAVVPIGAALATGPPDALTARPRRGTSSPIGAPAASANRPATAPSRFAVVTVPDGANVTINGVGYGTTPLAIAYLPPGEKRIRVTKPGFQAEERFIGAEASQTIRSVRIVLQETPARGVQ